MTALSSTIARLTKSLGRPAVLTLALALAACGAPGGGAPGSITELDYYTDQQGSAAWQKVLDTCSKKAGVTIQRQTVPTDQMLPKILQGATSRSLPNLVFTDNPTVQQIASTGALTPLSDYGIATGGYYDGIVKAGTYQGKVYGLAPGVNGLALLYNKDMLAEAGVQPPKTWDELTAAAAKLTKAQRYGLAFSAVPSEEGTWQFLPFFWSNGADLSRLDSDQAVRALGFVAGLVGSGSVSKSVLNWNQNDVADQFVAGNAAMMINGSWNLSRLDGEKSLHYGVVPIPTPAAGGSPTVALGGETGVIPATGQATQQSAAKVLTCILSPEVMQSWDTGHAYVPSQKDVAENFGQQHPNMQPFVTEVATARSRSADLGEKYPKISQALATAVQAAITGSQTPQQALRQAQQQAGGS
ncbi:ABC transporter substrate-binding protein [Kutzneria sp. 744]|uniref:ABC transporter substrate-binding protein n=1 Tax=Kutzneria sp. (strain 744) TaxID=345341 RepID=UPI0004B322C3|nr:extracellular solute-binding protein [Kutzneria sp. 744]